MTLDVNHDFLHSHGIDHDHAADGSIINIEANSTGGEGSSGSSIQSADLTDALSDVNAHDHTGSGAANLPEMGNDYAYQSGTNGSDRLLGGEGNDFLFRGDQTLDFTQAIAGEEFPFPTPSAASSEATLSFADGTLTIDGTFKDLQGAPLFSQGERDTDPNAEILNGSNPEALIDGFLAVPEDVEGNPLSGTHLHFSPAGDDRGDFADATVVRFLDNQVDNPEAGTGSFSGEFELTPEEQAALVAGNLYLNLHTNIDTNDDGQAGFPTGESRINLNQNVVRDAVPT